MEPESFLVDEICGNNEVNNDKIMPLLPHWNSESWTGDGFVHQEYVSTPPRPSQSADSASSSDHRNTNGIKDTALTDLHAQQHVIALLHTLYEQRDSAHSMSDLVLVVMAQTFQVHRAIVAAVSPFLRSLLINGITDGIYSSVLLLSEYNSLTSHIVDLIVGYIYTGKIELSADNVHNVKAAAETLQMNNLIALCQQFIDSHPETSTASSCVQTEELPETVAGTVSRDESLQIINKTYEMRHDFISPMTCKYCTRRFTNFDDYKRHLQSHEKIYRRYWSKSANGSSVEGWRNYALDKMRNDKHRSAVEKRRLKVINKISQPTKSDAVDPAEVRNGCPSGDRRSVVMQTMKSMISDKGRLELRKRTKVVNYKEMEGADDLSIDKTEEEDADWSPNDECGEEIQFKCKKGCGQRFTREQSYNRHMEDCRQITDNQRIELSSDKKGNKYERYKCNVCQQLFRNKWHASQHSCYWKCKWCKTTFKDQKQLDAHNNVRFGYLSNKGKHSTAKQHTCPQCNLKANSYKTLISHLKMVHNVDKPHRCPECTKAYKYENKLRDHIQVHSRNCPYRCDRCKRAFKSNNALSFHFNKMHVPPKKWKCKFCGKEFKSDSSLKKHTTMTHPHQCNHCEKAYKLRNTLTTHVKKMHTPKSHKCKFCDKEFQWIGYLNNHLRQHTPFVCEKCGERFVDEDKLGEHIKGTHIKVEAPSDKPSGETQLNTHKCDHCGCCFHEESVLIQHLSTVHMIQTMPKILGLDFFKDW